MQTNLRFFYCRNELKRVQIAHAKQKCIENFYTHTTTSNKISYQLSIWIFQCLQNKSDYFSSGFLNTFSWIKLNPKNAYEKFVSSSNIAAHFMHHWKNKIRFVSSKSMVCVFAFGVNSLEQWSMFSFQIIGKIRYHYIKMIIEFFHWNFIMRKMLLPLDIQIR